MNGDINGNLLDDGFALLPDDADAVNVLGDDLDGGLGLTLADGGNLQGLLLGGGVPLRLNGLTRSSTPSTPKRRRATPTSPASDPRVGFRWPTTTTTLASQAATRIGPG